VIAHRKRGSVVAAFLAAGLFAAILVSAGCARNKALAPATQSEAQQMKQRQGH
jgi:hypothetical protein